MNHGGDLFRREPMADAVEGRESGQVAFAIRAMADRALSRVDGRAGAGWGLRPSRRIWLSGDGGVLLGRVDRLPGDLGGGEECCARRREDYDSKTLHSIANLEDGMPRRRRAGASTRT